MTAPSQSYAFKAVSIMSQTAPFVDTYFQVGAILAVRAVYHVGAILAIGTVRHVGTLLAFFAVPAVAAK